MEPIISAVHITKRYGGVQALRDVSIDFFPGEVCALMGENGAGKSTLGKILSGVVQADHGEIKLNGKPVVFPNQMSPSSRASVLFFRNLICFPI